MSIPVASIVNVSVAIGAPFPARAGFGTLNIVTAEKGPIGLAERIRFYANLDGVIADWNANSEVARAATAYFSQQPKPTALKVSMRYPNAQSAQLRSGPIDLDDLLNIKDGSFDIDIGGTIKSITNLDFTANPLEEDSVSEDSVSEDSVSEDSVSEDSVSDASKQDMHPAVKVLQKKIKAASQKVEYTDAVCRYDNNRLYIISGVRGRASTIDFLTPSGTGTDISARLKMQKGQATTINGIGKEAIGDSLNAINNVDADWYGLLFTKEVRDDFTTGAEKAAVVAAEWCEARTKVFGNISNDLNVLDSVSKADIATDLATRNLRRTMTVYSSHPDQYPAASILGRAFVVNFNQPNSTITLKFKQMPGVIVETLTQSQKSILNKKRANALIEVGASDMYAESFMANGVFFDEVHGIDWLQNAIETNVFGYLLTRTNKVPYTDKGVAAIEQQLISALDEAVRNGLIAPGETIDGRFLSNGYETVSIPVSQINQSDKEARHYPGLSFTALGAGAIHKVQINGVFER